MVFEKTDVWGGANSSAGKGYPSSPTMRLYIAVSYYAAEVGNVATVASVKKAAFKGETAQPPPTSMVTLHR